MALPGVPSVGIGDIRGTIRAQVVDFLRNFKRLYPLVLQGQTVLDTFEMRYRFLLENQGLPALELRNIRNSAAAAAHPATLNSNTCSAFPLN